MYKRCTRTTPFPSSYRCPLKRRLDKKKRINAITQNNKKNQLDSSKTIKTSSLLDASSEKMEWYLIDQLDLIKEIYQSIPPSPQQDYIPGIIDSIHYPSYKLNMDFLNSPYLDYRLMTFGLDEVDDNI